jgi:hypothetical protein
VILLAHLAKEAAGNGVTDIGFKPTDPILNSNHAE